MNNNLYNTNIKMNFLSKAIIIFTMFFFVACEKYYVGHVKTSSQHFPNIETFSYNIYNDRVIIKGIINDELFVGDLYHAGLVRKIEQFRNHDIKRSIIYDRNNLSIIRLVGNKSNVLECFVKQKSMRNIKKGGQGRCYMVRTGQHFDITFERPYF